MTKKLIYLLYAMLIVVSAGCGSDDPDIMPDIPDQGGQTEPGPTPEEPGTLDLFTELKAIAGSPSHKMIVCAHRANTFAATRNGIPENSIPAIEKAAECGIDMIEIDPRATKDGVIVIMHNGSIDATTDGKGSVSGMTYDNLHKYNLRVGDKVTSYKVPTLSEALDAAKGKIYVCLDIKDFAQLDNIVRMVVQKGMSNQVCYYTGSSTSYLDQIIRIDKNAMLMPWVSDPATIPTLARFYSRLKLVQFNYEASNMASIASAVKSAGMVSFANHLNFDNELTANRYTTLQKFVANNIHVLQTDYGDLALTYMKQHGLRLE